MYVSYAVFVSIRCLGKPKSSYAPRVVHTLMGIFKCTHAVWGEGKILKSRVHLVLVVLAELLVGGLVQELVELGLVADLKLHEPSGLEGGLVHEGGVAVKVLQIDTI